MIEFRNVATLVLLVTIIIVGYIFTNATILMVDISVNADVQGKNEHENYPVPYDTDAGNNSNGNNSSSNPVPVQFLRTMVRESGRSAWITLETEGKFRFTGALVEGSVHVTVDSQTIYDLALLNLMFLLHEVGLRQVRMCEAPDCQHLFVKTYRREFCSKRCQQRQNKRLHRAAVLAEREQQLKRRRVSRARRVS